MKKTDAPCMIPALLNFHPQSSMRLQHAVLAKRTTDQYVQPPPFLHSSVHHPLHVLFRTHIALDRFRLALWKFLIEMFCRVYRSRLVDIGQEDVGALRSELIAGFEADAAG